MHPNLRNKIWYERQIFKNYQIPKKTVQYHSIEINTLMHSFPVVSSSTTTASIYLPMATVTARLNFLLDGVHRSVIRPWTPGNKRLRLSNASDNLASRSLSCLSAFNSLSCASISAIFAFKLSCLLLRLGISNKFSKWNRSGKSIKDNN